MIKRTTIPCADVKMHTFDTNMQPGETRPGLLHMTDPFLLDFHEVLPDKRTRNPQVFKGQLLNVALDKHGLYQANFRRLVLDNHTEPTAICAQLLADLLNAKKILAL